MDGDKFQEIRKYFSKSEWAELDEYELGSFLQAKRNYERMLEAG